MASTKPNVIFVLGGPGAGKGTQCARIAEKYGYVHLSAGDLLREEAAKPDSALGKEINEHIKNGSIVPVAVTCKLLENAMTKSGKENFLIDGFPRNKDNVDGWKQAMNGKVNIQCVLFFDCDEKTCVARCLERGKGSGRTDDNKESLKKRIVTYNDSTRPVIQLYEKENLVKHIDASNEVDKVFQDVQTKLGEFVKHALKGAIFALPFLTTFMDRITTLSLVDGISMQTKSNEIFTYPKTSSEKNLSLLLPSTNDQNQIGNENILRSLIEMINNELRSLRHRINDSDEASQDRHSQLMQLLFTIVNLNNSNYQNMAN
ncbi:unnamed protein product [Adineta steineri]|uniref:UMP-CMP kinase n=1 Tax=Adineta steineri TaxID=433720 RepID=A0A814LI92_9BILA|nr:unnamed protein product [Adineta steineri]